MRIAHLVPASFEYFDDIRSEVFDLVEAEHALGVDVEVFTLQYGTPTKTSGAPSVPSGSRKRKFGGTVDFAVVLRELADFDLVHVHCPFFGGLKKLVAWKHQHPNIPLVVTVYPEVAASDLFSYLVRWYNRAYLPRLLSVAEVVTTMSLESLARSWVPKIKLLILADYSATFQDIDLTTSPDNKRLTPEERLAAKYIMIYQNIV